MRLVLAVLAALSLTPAVAAPPQVRCVWNAITMPSGSTSAVCTGKNTVKYAPAHAYRSVNVMLSQQPIAAFSSGS